ncbi:hypothetical protein BGZ75_008983 [Mortierella antarctica]|nr:hypothetical protein BGZ75_008983 [Mortierella antarctica]
MATRSLPAHASVRSSSFPATATAPSQPHRWPTTPLLLALALLALPLLTDAAGPTTIARRGHTATLLDDYVHFVGGLGNVTENPSTYIRTISSLNLNDLQFKETPTTWAIRDHAATTNRTVAYAAEAEYNKVGIMFGINGDDLPSDALLWLDPATGELTPGSGDQMTSRYRPSQVQVGNNIWIFGGMRPVRGMQAQVPDTPVYDISGRAWSARTRGFNRYAHVSARIGLEYALSCCGASFDEARPQPCSLFSITSATFVSPQLKWDPALRFDDFANGRTYASMVTSVPDNNVLYIFGGLQGGKASQDLYRLDASKMPDITVTKIPPPADTALLPSARYRHAAVTVGSLHGFMIIQGGMVDTGNMSDPNVYYFDMKSNIWIDGATFKAEYARQKAVAVKQVDVWYIIMGILAGTLALGGFVGLYIHTGVKNDERERQRKEADERDSARFSVMEENSPSGERNMMEGKGYSIYPRGGSEDHSLSMGPFKSTSSLIQPEEIPGNSTTKKPEKMTSDVYQSRAHAVITEPHSPGGTTLTEGGNQSGYFSSSVSSSTPSRLHKNSSNGSSQHSRHGAGPVDAAAATSKKGSPIPAAGAAGAIGRPPGHEPYYNPRDLFLDDDDDSSITVSLASESTLSPWAGPVRISTDLAPPNPRFSRGAISQAHRQLVGSMNGTNGSAARGGDSSGWDTSSPGGSLSSREDSEHQRRSVNSMQWVSFEPFDLSTRPESGQFDAAAQRSNLTIRNASMYGNNNRSSVQSNSNMNRRSMFDGSDTTEDSGSYYSGPNGKRISTAMAARQQRRSLRYSQDSQPSSAGEPFATTVLPVVSSKVAKPTMAKVVTHQRGSRVVMPSQGPLGERGSATADDGESGGGLGIDFSGFTNEGYLPGGNSNSQSRANGTSFTNAAAYQSRRGSSTLNPAHNRTAGSAGATGSKRESKTSVSAAQRVRNSTNVILQMPPAPKNAGPGSGKNNSQGGLGGSDNDPSELRNSIVELSQDMPGFLNYGER